MQAAPRNDLDADYTPRYIWLAKLLRGWIEDGTYSPGSLLPSSARLAAVHSVSRATALHALAVLTKSGYVRHVDSKPHQVIWRLSTAATTSASFPGSAGVRSRRSRYARRRISTTEAKFSTNEASNAFPFSAVAREGRPITPLAVYSPIPVVRIYDACHPPPSPPHDSHRGLARVRMKKDRSLKLTSVHIFVVRRYEPCRLPGIGPVRPRREKRHALAVGVSFLDNVGQDVVSSMAINDDQLGQSSIRN